MNKNALIPLLIGLVVGVAALKLGYDYVVKLQQASNKNTGPTRQVVVAAVNLVEGTALTDKDLMVVAMPEKMVPEETCTGIKDLVGQTLRVSLNAKMPVLKNMFGPGQGLEGIIPAGYRAVAVKVDEFTSVGGLLRPGTKVDVLATFNVRKSNGGAENISKVVLQNVEVRAVGQQYKTEDTATAAAKEKLSHSVTLLVKSDQAEILQLAASMGSIRLALRNGTDDSGMITTGVTLTQLITMGSVPAEKGPNPLAGLFGLAPKPVTPKVVKPNDPYEVEVINGERSERLYFASASSDKRVGPKVEAKDNLSKPGPKASAPGVQASGE